MSINASFVGRVGSDAETREAGNSTVTSFSVAADQGFGDKKSTNWLRVSIWGERGSKLAQYITKGINIYVAGELTTEEYNGKTQFNIRANDVNPFLAPKQSGGDTYSEKPRREAAARAAPAFDSDLDDDLEDSVPF